MSAPSEEVRLRNRILLAFVIPLAASAALAAEPDTTARPARPRPTASAPT